MKQLRILFVSALGLTTFPLVGATAGLSAQTYNACRVPDVGAIYMINVAGAPSGCLDPSHVQFAWTEGGDVADGAVTEVKIADGAVSLNKIQDETITADKLAANSVGSAEIQSGAVGLFEMQDNSVGPQALGLEVVAVSRSLTADGVDFLIAPCTSGKRVIGGGYRVSSLSGGFGYDEIGVAQNGPQSDTEWGVFAQWPGSPNWSWTVYAICIIDGT